MAINKTIRFNGRTQDEVEKKYMQWHKDIGRRVHVVKMNPVERLDSGLPGRRSPAHDEEFMMLVEYEEQLRAEPSEPLKPAGESNKIPASRDQAG